MNNMTFEELWEHEERQGLERRLRQEYPAWRRRRRARRVAMASVAVLAGVAFCAFHLPPSTRSYDAVACNRSGIADSHWVDVAAKTLRTPAR